MTSIEFTDLRKRKPGAHIHRGLIISGDIYPELPGSDSDIETTLNLCGGTKPATTPPRKAHPDTDVRRMVRVLEGLQRLSSAPPRVVDSYVVRNEVR